MKKIFEHDSESSKSRVTDEFIIFDLAHPIANTVSENKSSTSLCDIKKCESDELRSNNSSGLSNLTRFDGFRSSVSSTYLSKRIKTVKDFKISLDDGQLDEFKNIMKEEFRKVSSPGK